MIPLLLATLATGGCGGSSTTSTATPAGSGALYTLITDTPACDMLGFSLFLTEVDLHRVGTSAGTRIALYPTSISPNAPTVEMTEVRDTSAIENLTSLGAGTYDQAFFTLTVPSAAVYDPSATPPLSNFIPTITTTNLTVNIQPPLVIKNGTVNILQLDFNLAQSLGTDSQGQLTGYVTPHFTVRPIPLANTGGFTDLGILEGFVRTVTNSSPGAGFTGAFVLQTLSGDGPAISVNLTSDTNLIGVPALNQLPTGNFVEVDGYINSSGNYVAKSVQVEARSDVSNQDLASLGKVVSVTRNTVGDVTQFDMLVYHTEPADLSIAPTDRPVQVNVSTSTVFTPFALAPELTDLATAGNLTFDPQTLVPGQEIVLHGIYTKPATGVATVAADQIYSRLQGIQGDFSSTLQVGSDDKTGAFKFLPCSGLVSATPFIVVTNPQTQFVSTNGLTSLNSATPLMVRGLVYWDAQGGTLNGVTIPAGTMVVLANRVRQF